MRAAHEVEVVLLQEVGHAVGPKGVAHAAVEAAGLGFDVDGPEDLDRLLASGGEGRTVSLLRRIVRRQETAT